MLGFITGMMPGWAEIVILLIIGVLIFGRRLPEVGRNVGRGIVEFKKGLRGIENEVEDAVERRTSPKQLEHDEQDDTPTVDSTKTAPKVSAEHHSNSGS